MKCNWQIKKMEEIAYINPRETLKKGTIAKKIGLDKLEPFCRDIIAYEYEGFSGGCKFRNGDTIMARITPCLENGKIAQVNVLKPGEIGFGSTEYIVFRAKEGVDEDYLYYLVCSPIIREPAIKSMVGSSGRQRVQTSVVQGLNIEMPPIKEQKVIAKILKGIDDKISLNKEINNNLEQQAMVIFDYFFPNITYGDKVIGDTIIPKRGKNLLSKNAVFGKVPVVAGGLTPLTYHNISNTVAPVLAISASGANAGYVSLWDKPIWSSDSSYIDSSMTKDVYFWYVLLKKRQTEIYESQTGSAQPHIYPKHIASMPVCDLKSEEISNFTLLVTPIFSMIHNNKEESIQLSILRETLLPKLLFGELDVSNIDI